MKYSLHTFWKRFIVSLYYSLLSKLLNQLYLHLVPSLACYTFSPNNNTIPGSEHKKKQKKKKNYDNPSILPLFGLFLEKLCPQAVQAFGKVTARALGHLTLLIATDNLSSNEWLIITVSDDMN